MNQQNDTTICFSLPQSRIILGKITKLSETQELLKISEETVKALERLNKQHESTIKYFTRINDNNESVIANKDKQITLFKAQSEVDKKEIKRQKLYKWIAIGGSIITTTAFLLK